MLFKVKHTIKASSAVLFHICIGLQFLLHVFTRLCHENKNIKKKEEKKEERNRQSISLKEPNNFRMGVFPPTTTPIAANSTPHPQTPTLNLARLALVRLNRLASTDLQIIFLYYPLINPISLY